MARLPTARVVTIAVAGGLIVGACTVALVAGSGGSGNDSVVSTAAPPPLQAGLPVYWLGEVYEGVAFDRVIAPDEDEGLLPQVFVTYGVCGSRFEQGCDPAFYLKIRKGCLKEIDENDRIRGRTFWEGDYLSIQTGDAIIEVVAPPEMQRRIADDMVPKVASDVAAIASGQELPGSLCELSRFAPPRPTRTPIPTLESEPTETEEERLERELAETVFASFGDSNDFESFDEAEAYLGWKLIRVVDPRYTAAYLCCEAGFTREYKGQPSFEQRYAVPGRPTGIDLYQEPESNKSFDPTPYGTKVTIGEWTGTLWEHRAQRGFEFFSHAKDDGERIRVSVVGERDDISEDDIRVFVASLELVEPAP